MGANPNIKCELGNTPLHMALMLGDRIPKNVQIIHTLMSHGANAKVTNDFGQTPIFFASKSILADFGLLSTSSMKMREKDFENKNKL